MEKEMGKLFWNLLYIGKDMSFQGYLGSIAVLEVLLYEGRKNVADNVCM